MSFLPSSSEWTRAVYPNALPFMVQHKCFDYCLPTPDCQLRYLPSPCVCTTEGDAGFNPLLPRVTTPAQQPARIGQSFSFQIVATNMAAGDTYAATNLPAGLTINAASGLISGTPTAQTTGVKSVTISATNGEGTGSATLRINLQAALPVVAASYAGGPPMSSAGNTYVLTDADIAALPQVSAPAVVAGRVITITEQAGLFGYVWAVPATLPVASQLIDLASGLNVLSAVLPNVRIVPIAQPFPGGTPVDYRVYPVHNNAPFGANGVGMALTIGT